MEKYEPRDSCLRRKLCKYKLHGAVVVFGRGFLAAGENHLQILLAVKTK